MEETKRFLRYVIPGLLLFIEISLYLIISAQDEFIRSLEKMPEGIGFPLSIFLAAGGIGFFLSLIYYAIYMKKVFCNISHKPLIKECIEKEWIKLKFHNNSSFIEVDSLSITSAWRIMAAFWNERKESSEFIKSANSRIESLADIMHGLGSSLIGSIIAIGLWLYIHYKLMDCIELNLVWIPFLISIIIIIIHWINYKQVKKDIHSIFAIIIRDELKKEKNKPIVINLSQIDFKKERKKICPD